MIRRFYVHNFRCLENFELRIDGRHSTLLIGKSGTGKSSVGMALGVPQKIGRGVNRVRELFPQDAVAWGRTGVPVRFEIELELEGRSFLYSIAFELPAGFSEHRVFEEKLLADGEPVFSREIAKVNLTRKDKVEGATFNVDWHLAALPFLDDRGSKDPVNLVRAWLGRMLILDPIPSQITGYSDAATSEPDQSLGNLDNWFVGLVTDYPASYGTIDSYVRAVIPDLKGVRNQGSSPGIRRLQLQFSNELRTATVPF